MNAYDVHNDIIQFAVDNGLRYDTLYDRVDHSRMTKLWNNDNIRKWYVVYLKDNIGYEAADVTEIISRMTDHFHINLDEASSLSRGSTVDYYYKVVE